MRNEKEEEIMEIEESSIVREEVRGQSCFPTTLQQRSRCIQVNQQNNIEHIYKYLSLLLIMKRRRKKTVELSNRNMEM